jgi:shikimate dehydrogenase
MQLALFGYPLSHSVSPAMHNAALADLGLTDWHYEALPIEPKRLGKAVETIRGEGYGGANVTVPHKEAVIQFLDGLTPVAEAIGAVNTLLKRDGKLIGHNTDAAGLLADFYAHDVHISGKAVLILGAGGAARAAVAAIAPLGCEIRVAARRPDQIKSLESIVGSPDSIHSYDLTIRDLQRASEAAALIINCTPMGMTPNTNASPWFSAVALPRGAFVYDMVYNPSETLLTKQARAAGLRADTGLGMLIEQGALALELWTGKTAPRKLMRAAAESKLNESRK